MSGTSGSQFSSSINYAPDYRDSDPGRIYRRRGIEQTRVEISMVTLNDYLIVSGLLFAIGFAGVLLRRNLIIYFHGSGVDA